MTKIAPAAARTAGLDAADIGGINGAGSVATDTQAGGTYGTSLLWTLLLPSATVFLLLLCNARIVLGPWVNGETLNLFTGAVIAALAMLSVVLTASVLYPEITGTQILWVLGRGSLLAICSVGVTAVLGRAMPFADHVGTAHAGSRHAGSGHAGTAHAGASMAIWLLLCRAACERPQTWLPPSSAWCRADVLPALSARNQKESVR